MQFVITLYFASYNVMITAWYINILGWGQGLNTEDLYHSSFGTMANMGDINYRRTLISIDYEFSFCG